MNDETGRRTLRLIKGEEEPVGQKRLEIEVIPAEP